MIIRLAQQCSNLLKGSQFLIRRKHRFPHACSVGTVTRGYVSWTRAGRNIPRANRESLHRFVRRKLFHLSNSIERYLLLPPVDLRVTTCFSWAPPARDLDENVSVLWSHSPVQPFTRKTLEILKRASTCHIFKCLWYSIHFIYVYDYSSYTVVYLEYFIIQNIWNT